MRTLSTILQAALFAVLAKRTADGRFVFGRRSAARRLAWFRTVGDTSSLDPARSAHPSPAAYVNALVRRMDAVDYARLRGLRALADGIERGVVDLPAPPYHPVALACATHRDDGSIAYWTTDGPNGRPHPLARLALQRIIDEHQGASQRERRGAA